ncbi:MAG: chemotaxis response regulator protein-glutamate methylesterase [Desulfobacterales bacterium]|nr:chemotaxis response regulator protein-glutamate methylesterase [Desulfobacterales bacterium]
MNIQHPKHPYSKSIRVLVVDDSALVREVLSRGLDADPEITVVGTASDPYAARDKIVALKPHVITLDVEMPRMDGVTFLRRLMPQYPLPVVMVSALTHTGAQITLDALEAGAVDFVTKPKADIARSLSAMIHELRSKVKIAATANLSHWQSKNAGSAIQTLSMPSKKILSASSEKVILIGASTGGTEAVRQILTSFPASVPGVVIVQHMPPGFTRAFAERLNTLCAVEVKEAENNDRIIAGRALIAPGGVQTRVFRSGGTYVVKCESGSPVCGHCPSVEVLMQSASEYIGPYAIGIMLTGMGRDGATGMLSLRKSGARTLAQDEASSVVFGMPKEAFACGGAERLVSLDQIADEILKLL